MKLRPVVRGEYASALLWICGVLETTPEKFLEQVIPYHVTTITAFMAAKEKAASESQRVSEAVPEDGPSGTPETDTAADPYSELGAQSE